MQRLLVLLVDGVADHDRLDVFEVPEQVFDVDPAVADESACRGDRVG